MATYAVTGATGFLGQSLTTTLLNRGHHVKALVRTPAKRTVLDPRCECVQGSLEDPTSLIRLVADADGVIHLAGAVAALNRRAFFRVNAAATTQLVQIMEQHSPTTPLLAISSLAARQPQLSDYAASKRAGETVVQASALQWTIVRPPAVFGSADRALRPLWQLLARGLLPQLGEALSRFSMIHVDDLSEALATLMAGIAQASGACLELDDGHRSVDGFGYGWHDLASIGALAFHRPVRIVPIPGWSLLGAATMAQGLAQLRRHPMVFCRGKVRELQYPDWVAHRSDVWDRLMWSPRRQLRDTLETLV